jgi:Tol biopolymer transport system component
MVRRAGLLFALILSGVLPRCTQQNSCETATDCPAKQVCYKQQCSAVVIVGAPCMTDNDCGGRPPPVSGYICQSGHCEVAPANDAGVSLDAAPVVAPPDLTLDGGPEPDATAPIGSPFGTLAFTSNRAGTEQIYLINADGTALVRLSHNAHVEHAPAWSPDGARIAFVSDRDGHRDVWVMDPAGNNAANLTHASTGLYDLPAWSPDGTHIAYARSTGVAEVWSMGSDGSGQTQLTPDLSTNTHPSWSPSGGYLVFQSDRGGSLNVVFDLYVMAADGTGALNLTPNNSGWDVDPALSPDGRRIAFARGGASALGGNLEIWVMNSDGSGATQLTGNGRRNHSPAWSHDSSALAFVSDTSARTSDLYVMWANGSGLTRVTSDPSLNTAPSWRPASGAAADAGSYLDASPDSGVLPDASPALDSGLSLDAGPDAGHPDAAPPADGGVVANPDAAPPADSGVVANPDAALPPDSGVAPRDASSPADASSPLDAGPLYDAGLAILPSFRPRGIYLLGDYAGAPIGQKEVLCSTTTPAAIAVGFQDSSSSFRIRPTDGALFYLDGSFNPAVRQFFADPLVFDAATGAWNYPANPLANDPAQSAVACFTLNGVARFMFDPRDGSILIQCSQTGPDGPDAWYDAMGAANFLCSTAGTDATAWVLGYDGSALCQNSGGGSYFVWANGGSHALSAAPAGGFQNVFFRPLPRGGFWGLALDDTTSSYTRWTITATGGSHLDGHFAPLAGFQSTGGSALALDARGRLFTGGQGAPDVTGRSRRLVVADFTSASDVFGLSTETTCMSDASFLFTGP